MSSISQSIQNYIFVYNRVFVKYIKYKIKISKGSELNCILFFEFFRECAYGYRWISFNTHRGLSTEMPPERMPIEKFRDILSGASLRPIQLAQTYLFKSTPTALLPALTLRFLRQVRSSVQVYLAKCKRRG